MSYSYNGNYSGRVLVYPDQVPFDTDILRSNQYRMVDVALLAQAILGLPLAAGGSFVGLSSGICTQNASPNMTVEIGVCALYSLQQMEPIAYGNLGPLSTPLIFKQFINMVAFNSSTLSGGTFVAPSAGNWQYYLIQGQPQTTQINSVNRPYYNASNPASPNFNAADDTEIDNIVFSVVAGTPSLKTGGLPALPAVSANNIGMFLVLVSDTTTSVTNALISGFPGSFVQYTLPQLPIAVQNQAFNFAGTAGGTANALTGILNPIPAAYTTGMRAVLIASANNTNATTLSLNGLSAKNVVYTDGSALVGGEIKSGGVYEFEYDGTHFQLINPFLKVTSSLGSSGYIDLPGGLIYQWGQSGSLAVNASATITLPIAFPNAIFQVLATPFVVHGTEAGQAASANTLSNSQITVSNTGSGAAACPIMWFAIGN